MRPERKVGAVSQTVFVVCHCKDQPDFIMNIWVTTEDF